MAQQTELSAATKRALEAIVGEKSATYSQAVREQHCRDESYHADTDGVFPPQAVVFPKSTEEVQEIVKLCARDKIPIVASGACTSLEGHLAALRGGVAINMREMNQVLEVNADDMDVRCQAGVTRKQLNTYIRDTGLMFTVDPGADATLGGMASTRASGTNTVKYGTMRDNVIQLSAVLADGSVIKAGSRARKSSTGYDLKNLLIGSEGTLGIITEVTVRLYGQPEAVSSAVCEFPTLADAVNCTIAIIQMGIPVAAYPQAGRQRQAGRQTDRQTGKQAGRQICMHFHHTHAHARAHRHMYTHTHTHTHTHTNTFMHNHRWHGSR